MSVSGRTDLDEMPRGATIAGLHHTQLARDFLQWMQRHDEEHDFVAMCLLHLRGCRAAVLSPCCGAPVCHQCMFKWWCALREHGMIELRCPQCNQMNAVEWFRWFNGAAPPPLNNATMRHWRFRRQLTREWFVRRNELDGDAVDEYVHWMLWRRRTSMQNPPALNDSDDESFVPDQNTSGSGAEETADSNSDPEENADDSDDQDESA